MNDVAKLKRLLRVSREKALLASRKANDYHLRAMNAEAECESLRKLLKPFADAVLNAEQVHGVLRRVGQRVSIPSNTANYFRARPLLDEWLAVVRRIYPSWEADHPSN